MWAVDDQVPRSTLTTPYEKLLSIIAVVALAFTANAAETKKCPVSGKDADPNCKLKHEGITYTFCCGKCCSKYNKDIKASVYHRLGGRKAINAAVDAFYKRVLADEKVNHFFEDVNMKRQAKKQKAFLSAAFGSPVKYTGKDMRAAHKHLDLTEADFGAIAGHLQATLKSLKVNQGSHDHRRQHQGRRAEQEGEEVKSDRNLCTRAEYGIGLRFFVCTLAPTSLLRRPTTRACIRSAERSDCASPALRCDRRCHSSRLHRQVPQTPRPGRPGRRIHAWVREPGWH